MDIIAKDEMPDQRELAVKALTRMADDLEDCLGAVNEIKAMFEAGDESFDFKKLREAINTLDNHTDGYWFRLVLGERGGLGEISTYVDNVETPYEEQGEEPAA